MVNPIRETDDAARAQAQSFLQTCRHAALGVLIRDGQPMVTRIAFAPDLDGQPISLISDLSAHTQALKARPACSLLLGEPEERGDPLTHPRLSLMAEAEFLPRTSADHAARAAHSGPCPALAMSIATAQDSRIAREANTSAFISISIRRTSA